MVEYKEMLGKKFHIIQNGLDPNEVTEFLTSEVGSSDTVFDKLEQFSALNEAAKTINDAIKQARELAEHAKAKVAEEAERRKAQAIEDGKEIAAKIINEAGKSVLDYFDNASSTMMEVMDEAFKKAKDQIEVNRTKTREQIKKGVWAEIDRIVKSVDRNTREPSNSEYEDTDAGSADKAASTSVSSFSDP